MVELPVSDRVLLVTAEDDPSGTRLFHEIAHRTDAHARQVSEADPIEPLIEEMQRSALLLFVVNAAHPFRAASADFLKQILESANSKGVFVTWIGVGETLESHLGPLTNILPVRWSPGHYHNLSADPSEDEIIAVAEEVADLWRERTQQPDLSTLGERRRSFEPIQHTVQMKSRETTLDLTRMVGATLPAEVTECDWLERLYLYRGQLESLPASIGRLKSLRELSIARNHLQRLPPELGNLRNLQALYLDHNQLTELPETIGQLENLEQLHIFHNQLNRMPELTRLQKLSWLTLDLNNFESFPLSVCALRSVRVLSLTNNRIGTLPPEIAKMENLEELYLRGNPIQRLPVELGRLSRLRVLDVDFEKVQFPPPGLLARVPGDPHFTDREILEFRTSRVLRFLRICQHIDPLDLAFQSVLDNRASVDLLPIPDLSRFRMQEIDWLDFAESTLGEHDRTRPNPLWIAWMRASHSQVLQTVESQLRP